MKDYRASVEKLRHDAAENRQVAILATVKAKRDLFERKRDLFERLAEHLDGLANEVERAMAGQGAASTAAESSDGPFAGKDGGVRRSGGPSIPGQHGAHGGPAPPDEP